MIPKRKSLTRLGEGGEEKGVGKNPSFSASATNGLARKESIPSECNMRALYITRPTSTNSNGRGRVKPGRQKTTMIS